MRLGDLDALKAELAHCWAPGWVLDKVAAAPTVSCAECQHRLWPLAQDRIICRECHCGDLFERRTP